MIKKFKEVFGKAIGIIRAYPMVLVMAFLAAVSMMIYIKYDYRNYEHSFLYVKFGLVSALGISMMYGLKMLTQRIGKEILFQIVGLAFLIFFYFLLPKNEEQFTEVYAFLLIPTFILSHLLVSFVAFLGKKKENSFWQYNKNLFVNLFLTVVFTGVLIGGIMLAILAVDHLFDFNFNSRYYAYTFNFLWIFGSSFIFLLFNEKGLTYLEKNGDYPVILKFFTQYVLVPLLFIYVIILYFYTAKILINWELPRGWVSYLILAYSVVGILAILLVHPLKEDSTKSWVKIFSKVFYYTLAPLIVLLFVAIFTRILEYGYTEPRYFVLLLALWLTTVVLYFIFYKKQTIKFVPISLFAFGLLSLTFPYLNTFSVAKRSQKSELMKTLTEKNMLKNGKINFKKETTEDIANDISSKFSFLEERKESDFLVNLLPKELEKKYKKDIEEGFPFRYYSIRNEFTNVKNDDGKSGNFREYQSTTLTAKSIDADISGYRYLIKVDQLVETSFVFENKTFKLEAPGIPLKTKYTLSINNEQINLLPEIVQLFKNAPRNEEQMVENLFITKKVGTYEIKILLDSVERYSSPNKNEEYKINQSVILLIK